MLSNDKLYDNLDLLYRELWGDSLHHGLWITSKESPHQARTNLAQACLKALAPQNGETIADIGCGYGTLSHRMIKEVNCQVHAVTNSLAQIQAATPHPQITFHHTDWLDHPLPPDSLDKALALESLSHFLSFNNFLSATTKALRPGAILVISDWFASPDCSYIETTLLNHLATTGAIPAFRPLSKFVASAARHDLDLQHHLDLSSRVAPTWSTLFVSAASSLFTNPKLVLPLIKNALRRPTLLTSFPFLLLAYHLGILRYHLCVFQKAASPHKRPEEPIRTKPSENIPGGSVFLNQRRCYRGI